MYKGYLFLCLILLALEASSKPNIKNLEKEDLVFSKFLIKQAKGSKQFDGEEHRVGDLPWANGELPLEKHYAGYIHIRSFKIFERTGNASLWLQGGPGSSSMIGLFYEMGPFKVTSNMKLIRNPHTWNKHYGMLFIDQPVGAGYSFVDSPHQAILTDPECSYIDQYQGENGDGNAKHQKSKLRQTIIRMMESFFFRRKSHHVRNDDPCYMEGYVSNQKGISKDLLVFLQKFYQRYPEQKRSELYIAGESYAGKYVPSFATAIYKHNTFLRQQKKYEDIFPLAGVAIGSGFTDPITQIKSHGEQAYQLGGLVSSNDADYMNQLAALTVLRIKENDFLGAREIRNKLFKYWQNVTGIMNYYDIRRTEMQNDWSLMERFLNIPEIKKSVNVGNRRYFKDLSGDIMKSTAHLFPTLIENYKVMLFQGNMDFRDGVVGNTEWLCSLEFDGSEIFRKKPRKIWHLDDNLIGYSVQSRNLTRIVFLQSGHFVPIDQPIATLDMITRFIENEPF
ncbi:5260_t:CDS:10 [Ambispora gerdemannii]|uniref:Carboxypeptidase n=1 Tax=Ambispora gerdemannii TaxID=144530 RepID=A0A9N8YP08_9GLOM|nr:5260_t:CDS:10 [Ambispora gerdemannii]